MAKRSAGSFQNIEEVAAQVESLEQSGFGRRDITIVSLKDNEKNIQSLTDVNVVTKEEEALDNDLLLSYGLDNETIDLYNTTVSQGGYVILIDGEAEPGSSREGAEANEGTLDTENQPIASPGAGNVPPPGFGIDPRTPPAPNSDLHGDPMNNQGDVPISDPGAPRSTAGDRRDEQSADNVDLSNERNSGISRNDDPLPELTNDSQDADSTINVRPIDNSNTPHSPRPEEQTDIPGESLDEDRGKYE